MPEFQLQVWRLGPDVTIEIKANKNLSSKHYRTLIRYAELALQAELETEQEAAQVATKGAGDGE